ncbi:hypothetical protein VKT23_001797 [Stygiomarasmius scandens]|uniref:Uncharacterized protein n=1 Tax=Marasmiellus scandens TaxID=2682957 RepID=A0ABR1K002_9AGAR
MTSSPNPSSSTKTLSTHPSQGFSAFYSKLASQITAFTTSNDIQQAASTSTNADAPQPLSLQPTELDYNPSQSIQPRVEELERMGIKVRDFAYESVLPPVPSYRRQARQVQPGPRPLKRIRLDGEDDEPSSQRSEDADEQVDPAGNTDRKVAELSDRDVNNLPARGRGYSDLNAYDYVVESQQSEWSSPSHSQPPLVYGIESQDSEPYISTPFVTPNGSLQWEVMDTSAMPASQLDTDDDILPNIEPGLIKKLSLHTSHDALDPTPTPSLRISLPSNSEAQTPPPKKHKPNPSPSPLRTKSPSPSLPPSAAPSPRYQLRTRRPAPPSPPPRGRSRSRPTRKIISPAPDLCSGPGPAPISAQSSQRRSRSSSRPKIAPTPGIRSSTRLSRREK